MLLLLAWLGLFFQSGASQHYFLLRPIPSDSLPLVELREDPDPAFDPKEHDFNETELRLALGDFDGRFLSVFPPSSDGYTVAEEDAHKPSGMVPKEIRAVDFDTPLGRMSKASKKLKRRLQQWLWAYSFCPVTYTWTDLGARFWPRYVRAGGCPNKRSCSVPEGMQCRPAASAHLTLLSWRCIHRKAGLRCAWIQVHYPVITDCKCSCGS